MVIGYDFLVVVFLVACGYMFREYQSQIFDFFTFSKTFVCALFSPEQNDD